MPSIYFSTIRVLIGVAGLYLEQVTGKQLSPALVSRDKRHTQYIQEDHLSRDQHEGKSLTIAMLDGLYSVQIHHLASLLPLRQPFTTVYPPFVFISKYGEGEICLFPEEEKDCWSGKHLSSISCTCGCMWDDT